MPNDAKLGLLAGIAGVVTAAVLFSQNPRPTPQPPGPGAVTAAPPAAGTVTPSPRFGEARPRGEATAATPVSARTRKEPEGRPVSRPAADEDE